MSRLWLLAPPAFGVLLVLADAALDRAAAASARRMRRGGGGS